MEKSIIHPLLFLVDDDFPYLKDVELLIQDLKSQYGNEFIHCKSLNVSLKELLNIKPGAELKLEYETKGYQLSYPIIIPFVALEQETSHQRFLKFLTILNASFRMFKTNDETDFRFLNVLIRDLKRNIYNDLSDINFYDDFENYCQESNIPIINFFNIIIDKFAENNLDELERVSLIFKQLSSFLILLYESKSLDILGLSHSYQAHSEEQKSSVRYNTMGMASIGIHDEKIIENISLRRKRSFLDEIFNQNEITLDLYLEVNKLSRAEIKVNHSNFQTDINTNVLKYSFANDTNVFLGDYDTQQEKCDLHLQADDMELETFELLKKIDEEAAKSKSKLEEIEERAILFTREKAESFRGYIKTYITSLFNYNKRKNNLEIVNYGLESLLEKKHTHIVTQQDSEEYETITDIKNRIEKVDPKNENTFIKKRDEIKKELSKNIETIKNQYETIRKQQKELELQWLTKNFKNLILTPLLGLLFLVGFLYFDLIKIGVASVICISLTGIIKTFFLKEKIKELRRDLVELQQRKKETLKKYIYTYNDYYKNTQEVLSKRETKEAYGNLIAYIREQQRHIKHFKKTLKEIHQSYIDQYTDLELNVDIFNRSLLSEAELEYFCTKNELYFFKNHQLATYYNQFFKDASGFKPIIYPKIEDQLKKEEKISPNKRNFNHTIHSYKNIEKIKTKIFLEGKEKSSDINYCDVLQGAVGDCYFLAALAGIVNKDPTYIRNKIKHNDNSVTVEFYDQKSQPRIIEIDHKFWVNEKDQPIYAQLANPVEKVYESWVLYVEKAWAKINGLNYTKINGDDAQGTIRIIDYSLALTGRKAIRERLTENSSLSNYHNRIQEHFKKKPIILYSSAEKTEASHKEIITYHAYTLIEVTGKFYKVYDPHGKEITLRHEELKYNFDLILYFDFEEQEDKHLRGIFSEYFLNPQTITLLLDFDSTIHENLEQYYYNKSLEDLLVNFNVKIDQSKSKDFAGKLLSASVPYVYTKETYYSDYTVFLFGDNKLINNEIQSLLKSVGVLDTRISIMSDVDRRIGVLKIHNNLTKKNITI